MSILSFPDRGPWGDAGYRGNASGHVYREVFGQLRPNSFVDPMAGSGTGPEAARAMGIEAYGLDLHSGFNILRHPILESVGKPVDLCLSHPPYHDMIQYSGAVYGDPHPDDLSRCDSVEDFLEKLHTALLNQREAVAPGGHYGLLIGDMRRRGRYYSFQAEAIARLPESELQAVVIKAQHNVASNARTYGGSPKLGRIFHEYLVIWQRPDRTVALVETLAQMAQRAHRRLRSTWRAVIRQALIAQGGQASLSELYNQIAANAPDQIGGKPHWKAKVRQVLQRHPDLFTRVDSGVWALAGAASFTKRNKAS